MHLIIDGYNLLHANRPPAHINSTQLQWERERLIARISTYQKKKSCGLTVVFDGWQDGWVMETTEKRKGVEIIFSRKGEKADEVIKRLAKEKGSGAVVITSDREVARFAQRTGVAVISSEQFREKLEMASSPAIEEGESEEEARGGKKKGPARRLSKKEKRARAASRKL